MKHCFKRPERSKYNNLLRSVAVGLNPRKCVNACNQPTIRPIFLICFSRCWETKVDPKNQIASRARGTRSGACRQWKRRYLPCARMTQFRLKPFLGNLQLQKKSKSLAAMYCRWKASVACVRTKTFRNIMRKRVPPVPKTRKTRTQRWRRSRQVLVPFSFFLWWGGVNFAFW